MWDWHDLSLQCLPSDSFISTLGSQWVAKVGETVDVYQEGGWLEELVMESG